MIDKYKKSKIRKGSFSRVFNSRSKNNSDGYELTTDTDKRTATK